MKDSSRASSATPVGLPVVAGGVRDDRVRGRPGQQHAGLLERLAHRGAHQRPGDRLVGAEQRAPTRPAVGPAQPIVGVEVARVDAAAGEDAHARRRTPSTSAGAAGRPRARRRRRRAAARPSRRARGSTGVAAAVGERAGVLDERRRAAGGSRSTSAQTSTISSTSTGASSGSTGTPTARAGVLAGVAEDLAEQLGGAVGDLRLAGEVGRRGDEHDDLDDPLDLRRGRRSRPCTAASALSAHCWAHSTASSWLTSPPTLPVVHQLARRASAAGRR